MLVTIEYLGKIVIIRFINDLHFARYSGACIILLRKKYKSVNELKINDLTNELRFEEV